MDQEGLFGIGPMLFGQNRAKEKSEAKRRVISADFRALELQLMQRRLDRCGIKPGSNRVFPMRIE